MKRWIAAAALIALLFSSPGCSATDSVAQTNAPTTTLESADLITTIPSETTLPTEPTVPETSETQPPETSVPPETTEPTPTEITPTELPTEPIPTEPAPDVDAQLLVKVSDYIANIQQHLYYATEDNLTGERIYDFEDAYLRYGTIVKLKKVSAELEKQGIGLLIWDAFRPLSAQAALWEACPDSNYVSNPLTGTRSHCRGSAVDLTLINLETGEELEMPSGFDDFTTLGNRDYSDCSPEAAGNAQLLEDVMVKYGFKPYSQEWWHYSDTDGYDIETYFDPAMDTLWYASCESSMSLRKSASTSAKSLATIYAGEAMEVIGWQKNFAKVRYKNKVGYVLSYYIQPVKEGYLSGNLDTVEFVSIYTYEMMMDDIAALEQAYSDCLTVETIGTSELGKDIPVIRIGSADAENHILFHASVHGCEYVTTWLIMAMTDYWLDHGMLGYGDVCYHIIPMVNPDGVAIAQTGQLTDAQKEIYYRDISLGYTDLSMSAYATVWKANGLGVDLNRNFDAGWGIVDGVTQPSYKLYAGEATFSASETRALRDYTLRYAFQATLSFHTKGNVLYYMYGDNSNTNDLSLKLAEKIRDISGYVIMNDYGLDSAGYKDWAIDSLGIPSLTVEVGSMTPVDPSREMAGIFARIYNIFPALALWVQQ